MLAKAKIVRPYKRIHIVAVPEVQYAHHEYAALSNTLFFTMAALAFHHLPKSIRDAAQSEATGLVSALKKK